MGYRETIRRFLDDRAVMSVLAELFAAKPLRRVETAVGVIFLTFDDGPHPLTTPLILDILKRNDSKATFFLVAEKAKQYPEIVRMILSEGHSIGNHSLDHKYSAFFAGRHRMQKWVDESFKMLADAGVSNPIGFRPPAGVVNPELVSALRLRRLRLILWDTRFYDTVFNWTPGDARKAAQSVRDGAIVLLHDGAGVPWLEHSGTALEEYLVTAKSHGFSFQALTHDHCNTKI